MIMKKLIFTFGRIQPYTIAHYHLNKFIVDLSIEHKCRHVIGISQTIDENNILTWEEKRQLVATSVPGITVLTDPLIKTPFALVETFAKLGYNEFVMVVGSDRVDSFKTSISKYITQWGINKFEVIDFGNRENGKFKDISGTTARQLAKQGNFESFYKMLSPSINKSSAKLIYTRFKNEIPRTKERNTKRTISEKS